MIVESAATGLPGKGRIRRMMECGVFVAVYVSVGIALRLDANAYLLLGIPLTVLFQYFVGRLPIRALWVRDAPPFRLGQPGAVIAIALMGYPGYLFLAALWRGDSWSTVGILFAATCGALCTAYARQFVRPDTARWLLLCLLTAGGIAVALMLGGALGPLVRRPPQQMFSIAGKSFLLYLPIVFVIEEVTFRGALDSHVHHPGESHGIFSAVWVSALWGLWHLPMAAAEPLVETVGQLLLLHIPVGVFLSIYWRRSGNLLVPGVSHAFMDAVRNAIASTII